MSHHIVSEVYKRQTGKMQRTAVLALLADKASDDGRGIYASKSTLADEMGCQKQTIITIIDSLQEDGLLVYVGERPCANGYTCEYRIDIDALEALPLVAAHARRESRKRTGQKNGPVQKADPTGPENGPHQSKKQTLTTLEPSLNPSPPAPQRGAERVRPAVISKDWKPVAVTALPPEIAALAAQWPQGAYEAEGAAFAQYWRGRGGRRADWDAQWAARVQARHVDVMRAAKAGVSFGGSAFGAADGAVVAAAEPVAAQRRENERSAELRAMLEAAIDPAEYATWLAPVAFVFEDCGLVVVTRSSFWAAEVEKRHRQSISDALDGLGRGVDWMRFVSERTAAHGASLGRKGGRRG